MNEFQLIESTFKFMKQFRTHLTEELDKAGIEFSPVFMKVLKMVEKIPECSAQKITVILEKDKAQITRAIKDMVSHGLLIQVRDEKDTRVKLLRLTDKGEANLKMFRVVEQQIEKSMATGISTEDLKHFLTVMGQIRANL
jgi:DNA-binding MarR family transcriptional regulator